RELGRARHEVRRLAAREVGSGRITAGSREPSPGQPQSGALPLRELRRLARLVQAGLLPLDLACVARQEALTLQEDAVVRIDLDERPRDAVPDGAGLAGRAAAVDADAEIVLPVEC